jgi:hypothetical protein
MFNKVYLLLKEWKIAFASFCNSNLAQSFQMFVGSIYVCKYVSNVSSVHLLHWKYNGNLPYSELTAKKTFEQILDFGSRHFLCCPDDLWPDYQVYADTSVKLANFFVDWQV